MSYFKDNVAAPPRMEELTAVRNHRVHNAIKLYPKKQPLKFAEQRLSPGPYSFLAD
jgi:hypothetical protein